MIRLVSRWLLCLLPLLLVNCSAGFNQEWNAAMANPSQKAPKDITGAWLGTWTSDGNGHHGELRCVVSHEDAKSDNYRFHYRATYGSILSAGYVVSEQVKPNGRGGYDLRGEHNLGVLAGGVYHYEGTSTAKNMKSTFRCPVDHGVFELARP